MESRSLMSFFLNENQDLSLLSKASMVFQSEITVSKIASEHIYIKKDN